MKIDVTKGITLPGPTGSERVVHLRRGKPAQFGALPAALLSRQVEAGRLIGGIGRPDW